MTASARDTKATETDAAEVVESIRCGKWRTPIESIRREFARVLAETGSKKDAKKAVDEAKKRLPGAMFSGTFRQRADAELETHSGLLCADLDGLGNELPMVRSKLLTSPHAWALFISPTGDGLKVVFRVPADANQQLESFYAVARHVRDLTGHEVDESCKNVSRLCFVSYDPGAFLNPVATELPPFVEQGVKPVPSEWNGPSLASIPQLATRQRIAVELVGAIDWETETRGYCTCPGKHLHTTGDGARDCQIIVDGAPTLFCFHDKCKGVLAGVNHELRSRIGQAEFISSIASAEVAQPLQVMTAPLTECEYADLLAARLPQIKTFGKDWFAYNGGEWVKTDSAIFRPIAQQIFPVDRRTARREKDVLLHLEGRFQGIPGSMVGFYRRDEYGNILLNVQNGVLRIAKGKSPELLPHSPSHGFTAKTVARYELSARAPVFEAILQQCLPDLKDRELFQLFAGYVLMPDCRYETALVCYGEAGSGKSTVAETIAATLGAGLVQRLSMSQICDPRSYHLPKLKFAAVNLGTELDAIEVDESANFKVLVSGEQIEARPIYGEPFTMATTAKLWFLANGLPRFKHGTEAELRRTRFIRFGHVPEKKDVTLKARLLAELDGVFALMVDGLQWLLTLPVMPLGSDESAKVHERFKVTNDPLGAFVAQRCVLGGDNLISKAALAEAYKEFCERYGLSENLGDHFFRMLYDRFTGLRDVMPRAEGGKRVRSVRGICFKTEMENN